MATLTTLQLAAAITSVSIYSKPTTFNGSVNSISAFGEQVYVKIATAGTTENKTQTVLGMTGTTFFSPSYPLYFVEKTITISLQDNQSISNVSITDISSTNSEIISYSSNGTINVRLYGNTKSTTIKASLSYTVNTTTTAFDDISLLDISTIATSESLILPLLSGGGLTSVAVNSTTSYFSEFGNKEITVVLSYYNTTTSSNETFTFSFYQELFNDSSEMIESIEVVDTPKVDIKDSLSAVLDSTSLTINYGDETSENINGETYFSDSSWYDNGTNKGLHLLCANGFYLNGTLMTEGDILISDFENVLFKENGDNEITISFYYYDSIQDKYTQFSLTFIIFISGITSVSIEPNNEYVPNRTYIKTTDYNETTLSVDKISISIFKSDGTSASLIDFSNYLITAKDKNTLVEYELDDVLPSGEYTITLAYKIRHDYAEQVATCEMNVYSIENGSLGIVVNKSSYIIGQQLTLQDLSSSITYPISNSSNTYVRTSGILVAFTPKTSTELGSKPITFSYNGRFSGYNLLTKIVNIIFVSQPYDYIYYFDKKPTLVGGNPRFLRHAYGEIQTKYNASFVLDGTKDSCQVIVINLIREELKPNTIIYLESTDTWWIVKQDNSKRYANEEMPLYEHTIKLFGLIELLNARDLTACGFNKDRYTISQMLNRLIKMSDIEFDVVFDLSPFIDGTKKITYLKTFENYTPYTALKELFNGMNCDIKATFITRSETIGATKYVSLNELHISPISKSGNSDAPLPISTFDNEEEEIKSDAESYGTRVVSNVQNCVSASEIRFPIFGGTRLTSNTEKVSTDTADTAVLRLPNNVYKVSRLYGYYWCVFDIILVFGGGYTDTKSVTVSKLFKCDLSYSAFKKAVDNEIDNLSEVPTSAKLEVKSKVATKLLDFYNQFISSDIGEFSIQNGGEYYPLDKSTNDKCKIFYASFTPSHGYYPYLALNDKKHADACSQHSFSTIYWEQGNNQIKNFRFLTSNFYYPKSLSATKITEDWGSINYNLGSIHLTSQFAIHSNNDKGLTIESTKYAVDYTPMSDIKIKVDNDKDENDTHLYNQNGKLIDSNAVSKLINSYSQSITSNEISRSKTYYNYFNIPKIGQRIIDGNDEYIVNNVSIDFSENDNNHYQMQCQFVMTKNIACKSTMISANTNIRDYDCPQQNNIVRKQAYRDYIEFSQSSVGQVNDTPFLDIGSNFVYETAVKGNIDNHTCIFKATMNKYGTYYYKLQCVKYNLKKQYIEVCDFVDNNIIGYEANKPYYLLTPETLFNFRNTMVNTPMSYVNDYGELNLLELRFVDKDQLFKAYNLIYSSGEFASTYINTYVSVPSDIWTYINADSTRYDIAIDEPNYKKDGLEVPFFEYVCQVGDTDYIIVGEELLNGEVPISGNTFIYGYAITSSSKINQENADLFMPSALNSSNATFTYDGATHKLTIGLIGNSTNLLDKNVIIFMFEKTSIGTIIRKELLFAINGCKTNGTDTIELFVSNYKLK